MKLRIRKGKSKGLSLAQGEEGRLGGESLLCSAEEGLWRMKSLLSKRPLGWVQWGRAGVAPAEAHVCTSRMGTDQG